MRRLLALLFLATATPLFAADYYVNPEGSDTCSGTGPNTFAQGEPCAWQTISHALSLTGCDTINVAAGDYYGEDWNPPNNCTFSARWQMIGAGSDPEFDSGTRVYLEALRLDPATCSSLGGGVYSCPVPAGARTDTPTTTNDDQAAYQWLEAGEYVSWSIQGTSGEMTGWAPLAWHTSTSTVASTPGSIAYDGAGNYHVHLWGSVAITGRRIVVPEAYSDGRGIMANGDDYLTIQGISFVSAPPVFMGMDLSDFIVLRDLRVYGGGIIAQGTTVDAVSSATIDGVHVRNCMARPLNGTLTSCTDGCWEPSGTSDQAQCLIAAAWNSGTIDDFSCGHARNGVSISNGSNGVTISRLREWGTFNHGMQILSSDAATLESDPGIVRNIVIRDSEFGSSQEGIFLVCAKDIRFEHVTISDASGIQIKTQITTDTPCPSGLPRNIDMHNSIINGVTVWYNEVSTDARCNGGAFDEDFDWTNNVYPTGINVHRHQATDTNMTLAQWQAWAGDCARTSTRDTGSDQSAARSAIHKGGDSIFQALDVTATPDADLVDNLANPAVDIGDPAFPGSGTDLNGAARLGLGDAGAFEASVSSTPACDDGVDNDGDGSTDYPADSGCTSALDGSEALCGDGFIDAGEECDGANLNGESCQSQGFTSGTLACSSCAFDTSGCVGSLLDRLKVQGLTLRGVTIR